MSKLELILMSRAPTLFSKKDGVHFGTLGANDLDLTAVVPELEKLDTSTVFQAQIAKINPEVASFFNLKPYSVQELIETGMKPIAALKFVFEHQCIALHLAAKTEAFEIFKSLIESVISHSEEYHKDWRNQSFVYYDFATTIMILLVGCFRGFSSIKKWTIEINSSSNTRALINALFPKALPPGLAYDHNSLYRINAMFAEACYGRHGKEKEEEKLKGIKALHKFFSSLKCFENPAAIDLFSYKPNSGFLKGETFQFTSPRFICHGFDGQEIRATYLPENASSKTNYTTVNLYDCTNMRSIAFRIRTKKNHEREAFLEMLNELKKEMDLTNVVFIADALNTTSEIVDAINAVGAKYILIVKSNNGNKAIRCIMSECLQNANKLDIKHYVSPIQYEHGREEQVTVQGIDITNINIDEDSCMSINLLKYPSAKTFIKFDKVTKFIRNNYSDKALKELNAATYSDTEQPKSHRWMISNIGIGHLYPKENFVKTLCVINDHWKYETAHFHYDDTLNQDRLQMSNEKRITTRVGYNQMSLDFGLYVRDRMLERWNSVPEHERSQPPSLKDAYQAVQEPLAFIDYLCEFLRPVAKAA